MYILNLSPLFKKKYQKLVQKDKTIIQAVEKALLLLQENPRAPVLKSHKVTSKTGAEAFSSRVTGDLRIIWDYHSGEAHVLDIINIGGHEGGKKVYK